jgi:neutral ceramidase
MPLSATRTYSTVTLQRQSIARAHANVEPVRLYLSEGELHGANINRSPTSYLANPRHERER